MLGKKFPFHTFFLAIYFTASLLASNLGEIKLITVPRLILAMVLLATVWILLLVNLLVRDICKAGLIVTPLVIIFSIYGLVYSLKTPTIMNGTLGRHRLLAGIFVILIGLVIWLVTRKAHHISEISLIGNIFAIYLLAMPLVQTAFFTYQIQTNTVAPVTTGKQAMQSIATLGDLPDIYYIILDAYDRGDYLTSEFGYDNRPFLDHLREAGFYIADCSRSNYAHTFLSISSALNMEYVQDYLSEQTISESILKDTLVHSQLREDLRTLGYQIVAFDNVHWDFSDADTFYVFEVDPFTNPYLFPIESVFINNSALKLVVDLSQNINQALQNLSSNAVHDHYLQQKYILDSMEVTLALDSPKFVFIHIEKPHGPYVFEPDGKFIVEDAFYRDLYHAAINVNYDKRGYVKQLQYLNNRMITFVDALMESAAKDTIVIIQGDHGIQEIEDLNARMAILNAVYFPDQNYANFYTSITPVNTFRIVEDHFFGEDHGLLEDKSYYSYREDKMDYFPVEENMAGCVEIAEIKND